MFINSKKAFTLVEVLVSLSIITAILSVVMWNYGGFNDRLALTGSGQELAIAIRQAQTYGLTVKEVGIGSGQFNYAYGIYFNPTISPSDYYVFVDSNANKIYDVGSGCGSGSTECVEKFSLRNNVKITSICDGLSCPPVASAKSLDVTFLRPNPDATINFTDGVGNIVTSSSVRGKVIMTSPKGMTLTVTIESTGQILVQ